MDEIKTITAVAGSAIGVLGLLYGFFKDRQVRHIEKRAKAPHFVPRFLQIDASSKSIPQGGKPFYSYRKEASGIDAALFGMETYETVVPSDYPDNRVVAVVVKNDGSRLRFFRAESDEKVTMREFHFDDHYEFRYFLNKEDLNKSLLVKIAYETEAGLQGKQVWSLQKGRLSMTRLKPRTV
jgi:hypothetical protein